MVVPLRVIIAETQQRTSVPERSREKFSTLNEMEVTLGLVGGFCLPCNCPYIQWLSSVAAVPFGEHIKTTENSFPLLRASLLDQGSLKISVFEIEQAHMAVAAQTCMLLKFLTVYTNVSACDKGR